MDVHPLILLEEAPLHPKLALGLISLLMSLRILVRDEENATSCHWAKHIAIQTKKKGWSCFHEALNVSLMLNFHSKTSGVQTLHPFVSYTPRAATQDGGSIPIC